MKIIQVSPESKVYPILSWTFMNLYRQLYRARCQFEIFYDVHSKIVSYPNTGFIGFLIATLQGFHIHLCLWMNGWKATIGINGFWSGKPLVAMVFQWFPMVANHWSDDGMVTIHRSGLSRRNVVGFMEGWTKRWWLHVAKLPCQVVGSAKIQRKNVSYFHCSNAILILLRSTAFMINWMFWKLMPYQMSNLAILAISLQFSL